MVYKVISERYAAFCTLFIVILWNILSNIYGRTLSLFFYILLLAAVLASVRVKFSIYEDHLEYQLLLFNKSIKIKKVFPSQINQLKLMRTGWAKKAAKLKLNRGMNIRLAGLNQPEAYDHLIEFAEKHAISIFKTKDYTIVEKMK